MITQEEQWALNVLTQATVNAQAELQRLVAARNSNIKLLEDKYNAVFNQQTGQFEPKPKKVKEEIKKDN